MDLTLWTASKNCLKGEWVKVSGSIIIFSTFERVLFKIIDVSPFLLETFPTGDGPNGLTSRVLKSQITSEYGHLFSTSYMLILKLGISWSKQADFGLIPPPPLDGSFLVTGSRAGFLTLLRLLRNSSTFIQNRSNILCRYQPDRIIRHIQSVPIANTWITHISISSWTSLSPGSCEI